MSDLTPTPDEKQHLIAILIYALDDLLETCELNGMHDDAAYKRSKAVCKEAQERDAKVNDEAR